MNTETNFSVNHVIRSRRSRYNPLTGLSNPSVMGRKLDSFEAGYLREAAVIWDALEQRDDVIRAVVAKRKKAVARHGFTVLPKLELSESEKTAAREHVAALEYFYNNIQCEHGLDNAEKGGFKLLVRQMMDAVGKRFSVHEITWNVAPRSERLPGDRRSFVSAKFRFVPLSFFENTTGQLRFLDHEAATEGQPLAPGSWMVTAGDGLMIATSAAWVYKNMGLTDWLLYSERNGRPIVRGLTSAAAGSAEWDAMEAIVANVIDGESVVHSASDDLKVLDLAVGGNIPFPALVDRMDRMIAALWRGADLSTISRDRGYGASLQEKETCVLRRTTPRCSPKR